MQKKIYKKEKSISETLEEEGNQALIKGSFYSTLLGISCAILIFVFLFLDLADNLLVPAIWSLFAGTYSFFFYLLAKRNLLRGWRIYVSFFPFISLPTLLFIASHFLLPSGAASYITGPVSYIYFHVIIMTGFLFDSKLSIFAGIISAIEFTFVYFLARKMA